MEVVAALLIALTACAAVATPPADPATLTSLTVEQARDVAGRKWYPRLRFDALVSLDPAAAAELVKHDGEICFAALTDLSPDAARALGTHKPGKGFGTFNLEFRALRQISPETAAALTANAGNLRLPAMERLDSADLARKLAGQWGELKVGVTELSPEIAAILATNEGVFEDRSRPNVVLQRADKARSVLWFAALKQLEPAVAESLAAHQGVLVLNELTELSPEAAAALARRKGGSLILNGLDRLSPETAAALAAYDGEIALRALRDLSPETATALAAHRGRLHLMRGVDVRPVAGRPSP
jgi:hypothetical protein